MDEQNVDVGELPTDLDVLLEAVSVVMGDALAGAIDRLVTEEILYAMRHL